MTQNLPTEMLTDEERSLLAVCEEVIAEGLKTFLTVGGALLKIRDERLYREQFPTFEAYCSQKWKITGRRGHQLANATQVYTNLVKTEPVVQSAKSVHVNVRTTDPGGVRQIHLPPPQAVPANERQLRPLTDLEPEQQKAWELAVERSGGAPPTGREVQAAAHEIVRKTEPPRPQAESPYRTIRFNPRDCMTLASQIHDWVRGAQLGRLIKELTRMYHRDRKEWKGEE
jgi:hypothetical protein